MKDDLNQMLPEPERRHIRELFERGAALAAQMRVDALRVSMGLPPQPTLPIRDEDFRLPIEGEERE